MVNEKPKPGKDGSPHENTNRPVALPLLKDNLPGQLTCLARYVVWKYVPEVDPETGETDWDKPPFNARTGGLASSTNPSTWNTFADALKTYRGGGWDGIGFVLHRKRDVEGPGLVGVDLDKCRDPETGTIEPWALDVIAELNSYTEVSPSGCGIRIFAYGKLPPGRRKKGHFEVYETGRYVTVTGQRVDGTLATIENRQAELEAVHARMFAEQEKKPKRKGAKEPKGEDGQGPAQPTSLEDREVLRRATECQKSGAKFSRLWAGDASECKSKSEADLALCNYLRFWGGRDAGRIDDLFRQSGLFRSKWNRDDYRDRTIALALNGDVYDPSRNGSAHSGQNNHFDTIPKDWERPIPYPVERPAAFPIEVFCRPLREMAEAVAAAMPCPVDMPAITMMAAASSAIGSTVELRVKKGWSEQPRLWLATICQTGSKKSPASAAVLRPVHARQQQLREDYKDKFEKYERDLENWMRRPKGDKTPKPKEPIQLQAWTSNHTMECLPGLIAENPRGLLLHRDELTGWVKSLNQYKGGRGDDKEAWLSYWSGESVVINRCGRRVFVDRPFLSVSGNLPPDMLNELNDEFGREDGFIHRILFSWPEPAPGGWSEAEPDDSVVRAYDALFEGLYRLSHCEEQSPGHVRLDPKPWPHTIRFTPEGKAAYVNFVNRLAEEMRATDFPAQFRGPWAKMEGYCARFSLLLHVTAEAAGETVERDVGEADVRGAVRLADYFMGHARRVYPCLASTKADARGKDAEAVLAWVRRNRERIEAEGEGKPKGAFSWRTVRHDLHNRFDGREADLVRVLQDLEGRGYFREVVRPRAGTVGRAPKPDYFVNPETWCRNAQNDRNGQPPEKS